MLKDWWRRFALQAEKVGALFSTKAFAVCFSHVKCFLRLVKRFCTFWFEIPCRRRWAPPFAVRTSPIRTFSPGVSRCISELSWSSCHIHFRINLAKYSHRNHFLINSFYIFHLHVFKLPFSASALLFHLLLSSGPNFKCTAWALCQASLQINFEFFTWTHMNSIYNTKFNLPQHELYHYCITSTASTVASAWIRSGLNT